MSARPSRLRLDDSIANALDAVAEADRQWFLAHPSRRHRVRRADPGEHRAHSCVALVARIRTPLERGLVLVLTTPERNARVRYFVDGDVVLANSAPELVWPPVAAALRARTNLEFFKALAPYLKPVGRSA